MSAFDAAVEAEIPVPKEAPLKACDHETDPSKYSNKLIPRVTISDNTSEVFCCEFSSDGLFLAAGCGDGAIRVFNAQHGTLSYNLQGGSNVALPTTALHFRPSDGVSTRTRNVFIAANAAGAVQHWHMTSGKCLHTFEDDDNQVFALNYNKDGSQFSTGGKDSCIRVYDEATKTKILCLAGGSGFGLESVPGHSNRVFSCKYVPQDQNVLITGGWDNTVKIWDLRAGHAVRGFYGPHICGDALDICGDEILTGSWRPENQLQIWDYGTGKLIQGIDWNPNRGCDPGSSCMLYAAKFSKEGSGRYIVAGGSGANEAKVFDHKNGNTVVGTVTGLLRGVFAVDFSPDNELVAIAGGDATIRILQIGS